MTQYEMPEECLKRACSTCPFHNSCIMEKRMINFMEKSMDYKYFKALTKQQLSPKEPSK